MDEIKIVSKDEQKPVKDKDKQKIIQKLPSNRKNAFVRFFNFLFVKNIGYKLLAIFTSAVIWILTVGL